MNIHNSKEILAPIAVQLEQAINSATWYSNVIEVNTDDEHEMATSLQVQYALLKMREAHKHLSDVLDYLSSLVPFTFEPKYWVWQNGECEQVEESMYKAFVGDEPENA